MKNRQPIRTNLNRVFFNDNHHLVHVFAGRYQLRLQIIQLLLHNADVTSCTLQLLQTDLVSPFQLPHFSIKYTLLQSQNPGSIPTSAELFFTIDQGPSTTFIDTKCFKTSNFVKFNKLSYFSETLQGEKMLNFDHYHYFFVDEMV